MGAELRRGCERAAELGEQWGVDDKRRALEPPAMVVAAEPDALAAVLVAQELDRGLVPLPDGGDLFDDGAFAPRHRERTRNFARLTLHVPHADTRLQSLRGAVRPARAPRLRDPRRRARLRQRRRQRSLPPLARPGRPRPLLVRLPRGRRRTP